MFLSMNWIQDFVDLSGLDKIELIRKFSLSTAEVENDILRKGSEISGIVVGEIKSVENHPDSKKLHLLKIDAGEDELIDVVCGAPNVRVGLKTAFAKVGAKIGEITITPRPLAGFTSNGMCFAVRLKSVSAMTTPASWKLQMMLKTAQTLKTFTKLTILFLRLITSRLQTVPTFGDTTESQENLPHLQAESLNLLTLTI